MARLHGHILEPVEHPTRSVKELEMARLHGHILEPVENPTNSVKDNHAQGDQISWNHKKIRPRFRLKPQF